MRKMKNILIYPEEAKRVALNRIGARAAVIAMLIEGEKLDNWGEILKKFIKPDEIDTELLIEEWGRA